MSNKHYIQANSFGSNDGENIIVRQVKFTLDQGYSAAQFDDNDLIQKQAVTEMMVSAGSIVSVPTGTAINSDGFVVIDYTPYEVHGNLPRKEWYRIETDYIAIFYPEIRQYPATGTPSTIRIYAGDIDDGTGHTNHDYQLVLR